jgi:hypothetical protein
VGCLLRGAVGSGFEIASRRVNSVFTLPQGGSLRRNDEAGRAKQFQLLRNNVPRWIAMKDKPLPARSSRPSQGEGESCVISSKGRSALVSKSLHEG